MKIAIVVQGRFHAFELAKGLIDLGEDVTVFTNYPKSVATKFGLPRERVRSFLIHALVTRCIQRLSPGSFEKFHHELFGRWARRQLAVESWDILHAFSGVALESLSDRSLKIKVKNILRGSSHIEEQHAILQDEEYRIQRKVEKPSRWMRQREQQEYEVADYIFSLSSFAKESFLRRGFANEKICLVPLGANLSKFLASPEEIHERIRRVLSKERLRVLTVGTWSARKGAFDLNAVYAACKDTCTFRFVGGMGSDSEHLKFAAAANCEFVPKQPQYELMAHYSWADVFLFPTLEDGYAVVLAQAQAAGLPLLATVNCIAPDIVTHGKNGWLFPIRTPQSFINTLRQLDGDRQLLASAMQAASTEFAPRGYREVAADIRQCFIRQMNR